MTKKIIPSILTDNPGDFKNKLRKLRGLTREAQFDFADGRFTKSKTLDFDVLIQNKSRSISEVHLMALNPEKYLSSARKVRIKRVIFHFEAVKSVSAVLKKIERMGLKKGLALNLRTPVKKIRPYLNKVDLILLMAVRVGFGGQKFSPPALDKIKKLRAMSKKVKIEVDGGVNLSNIGKIARAGADYFVVGVGLFGAPDVKKRFQQLKSIINAVK